ncbi:methylenetetrahydrofolate reductase [NAD(P)H] [Paracoccus suum]|uniref:Methylenetetrahydrofolate reductase n=1 Tax=Paracoccus suum TaxID=2259340 RepID=A0A344PH81_9RHOB|nr:methylenetetrahydrofolate reductase [NAD(P)H] [Paracoccus suum]AXC48736.1 methylenetetrahydrofolate reductase [NAD(P)H] [Paracoccus suum]
MSPRPRLSFEFFPPKSLDGAFRLSEAARMLAPYKPGFVSVTYGAGGTTRQLTHEAVTAIGTHYGLNVAAHLTCVEATRDETLAIVDSYAKEGVREIVALRGDMPGGGPFVAHPDGFSGSVDLIEAIAARGDMTIRVGAYPEPHPDSQGTAADIAWLKRKIEAGATSAITQFFFDADTFFRFRDACAAAGVDAPIVPGILPIQSWDGAKRFAARCGTSVPEGLDEAFTAAKAEGREQDLAADICADLCRRLGDGGVQDLHFYTLNRPEMTRAVLDRLGIPPEGDALAAVA